MSKPASQSFLRHALVYGSGIILLQAGGFILVPVYTRCLTPEEYGTLEVLGRTADIVMLVLLFSALRQAGLAFYNRTTDDAEKRRVASTLVLLGVLVASLGMALLLVLGDPLCRWLRIDRPGLFTLAIAASLADALLSVMLVFSQARQQSILHMGLILSHFLARIAVVVFLVAVLGWGVDGVLLGTLLVSSAWAVCLTLCELAWARCWPSLRQLVSMAAFALPFLPAGLCFFMLHNGDRFFLVRHGGEAEVARYALGYKLAMVVSLLGRSPFQMVWSARMFEVARQPDAARRFGDYFSQLLGSYQFVGLGVCLFASEIIAVLGGAPYRDAALIVAPVVLAYLFMAAADLMEAALFVRQRTIHKTWIALCSATIMLACYALLIPRWGAMGAALATLVGLACHACITFAVTRRIFPVEYQWSRLAGMIGSAIGLWLLGCALPHEPWTIVLRGLLWLSWPVVLWRAGWLLPEEKAMIRDLCRQGRVRAAQWLGRGAAVGHGLGRTP